MRRSGVFLHRHSHFRRYLLQLQHGLSWVTADDTLYNGDALTLLVIQATSSSTVYEDNLNLDVTPTPEPGSLILLGTGLFGLAFIAYRKSRAASVSLHS